MNKRAGIRPPWLKIRVPGDIDRLPVAKLMHDLALNTVCQEARCPNIFECWGAGTATFMILGEICTRRCTFCAVGKGELRKWGGPHALLAQPESIRCDKWQQVGRREMYRGSL